MVLTGHRRAGKSCILELLAAELAARGNVIYVDMEDPENADLATFRELSERIKGSVVEGRRNYVLIDEVQEVREFERALRYWVKQDGVDVVVTGSNAAMLSSDIASSFAGRYTRVHVSSLDYREFLQFYGLEDSDNAFASYLRWGGLPFLYRIPLEDERTRTEYLKRYDIKGKSVFEQQDKYYFEDLGLRNYLCRDKRSFDVEKVLEGAVYLKLKRSGYDVYVGQLNGKEIDFVARRGDEVIYVQVALQVSGQETYEREFAGLKLIKDNYPKYVVTMDPNVALIHDSGIVACFARQFLLD